MITYTEAPELKVKKNRAIVFGGGIGMFPPLMIRFEKEFEVVDVIAPDLPTIYKMLFLLRSIRFPKATWYRQWRRYVEHIPFSFRAVSRRNERLIRKKKGEFDLIFFMGAMSSLGAISDKPLFIITDSCRWLSSRNKYDESCHFKSKGEEHEWLAIEGQMYRSAARIFVGSEFVRKAIIEEYGVSPQRVVAVGFGAGTAFGEEYQKQFDGKTILYVGKGDFEKKGGLILLEAFATLRRKIPDATLHIVGQDNLQPVDGVVSHGFVSDRTMLVQLMELAHVLVLPSLVDRFGIALVEAMASATPCITSDYGALPEIVGDAGLVVPCGDQEKLAEAISIVLLDNKLATQLGKNGYRRYKEKYNWDRVWGTMHTAIKDALAEESFEILNSKKMLDRERASSKG